MWEEVSRYRLIKSFEDFRFEVSRVFAISFFFSLENENYIQKTICTHCTFINNWRDEDDERITNTREDTIFIR